MSMIFKPIHRQGRKEKEREGAAGQGATPHQTEGVSSNTNEHLLIQLDYFLQRRGLDRTGGKQNKESK